MISIVRTNSYHNYRPIVEVRSLNRKVYNRIYNYICRRRLQKVLPTMESELNRYFKGSTTTGTQPITLWLAVKKILNTKPRMILESGTGASSIVLSLAVKKLKSDDPNYECKIISMESVKEWYDVAKVNLPAHHADTVELIYGPREKYEISMFRGYIHSNIPERDFDFVFLDGPNFEDDKGTTFCADALYIYQKSGKKALEGVFDGRASTAFVIQTLFGRKSVEYFIPSLAGTFQLEAEKDFEKFNTTDFRNKLTGRLFLRNR